MTTYAHIATDGTIVQVGALPRLWWDGIRWHDWRDLATAATDPAVSGWLPVTITTDYSITLAAGVPTVTWTPRPWTSEELAAEAEQDARLSLEP